MFGVDFYPTPDELAQELIKDVYLSGRVVLEPSAGVGNLIRAIKQAGAAQVLACEIDPDFRTIIQHQAELIEPDFLKVQSHQVSHIHAIIMNPPFSKGSEHILHAFNIAPPGCEIRALCNIETMTNRSYKTREELGVIVDSFGSFEDIGKPFERGDRYTAVRVALVRLKKPGETQQSDFEGFFMDDEPEHQEEGLIKYNVIRDIVNRYVEACKIYDEQAASGVRLNNILATFYGQQLGIQVTEQGLPILKNTFRKQLQKEAWKYIFKKLSLEAGTTKGLREDINKFVEQQTNIPFTMRNVYRMLEIIAGTTGSRMDKALLEVFETLTRHSHDNRYGLEGWKTNGHYLINETFIVPYIATNDWGGKIGIQYNRAEDTVDDMVKALCFITGDNWERYGSFRNHVQYTYKVCIKGKMEYASERQGWQGVESLTKDLLPSQYTIDDTKPTWGQWFDFAFFRVKVYKKGTGHFQFKDRALWEKFNKHIARIKGYPLPEAKAKQPKEKKVYEKQQSQFTGKVLFTIKQKTV